MWYSPSPPSGEEKEIPTMDWLTDGLKKKGGEEDEEGESSTIETTDDPEKLYIEDIDPESVMGESDAPIPSTGVTVADEILKTQQEGYASEVVKIRGLEPGILAAQIVTTGTISNKIEAVRYLIGLSKQAVTENKETREWDIVPPTDMQSFAMVDIPPYSPQLEQQMKSFMGPKGKLAAILMTSRDCIHYDEAPGIYSNRQSDMKKWRERFPEVPVVAYRIDIPRECREFITQRLDGYGPFAFQEEGEVEPAESSADDEDEKKKYDPMSPFIETGQPLTYELWDFDVAQDIFAGKISPDDINTTKASSEDDEEDLYSPEAIRAREEGKRILAVYTPGRTYGSVSYVFPEVQLVASGYTIPVEDNRLGDGNGMPGIDSPGPSLDVTGYITTSKAGITRQMESARNLIENYADRFDVILPSQNDPFFVDAPTVEERKADLLSIIDQYEKIGQVYEELGITSFGG